MGAGDLLRDIDRRLLPLLARGLDRLLRGARGARGGRRPRLLTVAAVASVTAVLLVLLWVADRRPPDAGVGDVARVGVVDGQSIPGYLEASRSELARLVATGASGSAATPTYALVTLTAYLAPERLAPVLSGVEVAEVYARVPLPGRQTEIVHIPAARVPADVVTGMAQVAERKDREAAEFATLSAKLTGRDGEERRLRSVYTSGAQVAAAEAKAYRSRCSCLYAAVVRGTPVALDRVADRSGVRAVDPAPEVRRLDRAVFLPPLPEQTDAVRPPASRSPSPSHSPPPGRDRFERPARPSPSESVTGSPPRAPEAPSLPSAPAAPPVSPPPTTPEPSSPSGEPVGSEPSTPGQW